jgi:hypothetical protein
VREILWVVFRGSIPPDELSGFALSKAGIRHPWNNLSTVGSASALAQTSALQPWNENTAIKTWKLLGFARVGAHLNFTAGALDYFIGGEAVLISPSVRPKINFLVVAWKDVFLFVWRLLVSKRGYPPPVAGLLESIL